ncbi:glycine zipper 2TM domain-containing protein [Novosphingobium mangrovi (ex Huang et al. 2023)]|uniref:17 kDa surface antigen n=1 Tax=Novosphingobium mangrovi (ex Huang et al. 2023) TaxID=2976432 RepID=A0ABT2I0S5_9SPHN|nr:glycine zipper 2TM domain-containing protein [Novosphingobium mangrovi (ex Huang et al. 2023)]MCT2398263.1 glycine zipper 2TM domain-containing protein [Novosphingobium mangrovi (ex Huang et al. 2023)]
MNAFFKASALAAAAASLATAVPASAMTGHETQFHAPGEQAYDHSRIRYSREDWRRGYRPSYGNYGEPVYRDTRVWRGRDGRYYCRRQNGTTGLIIGGAAGALLGREIDGGRDRTLGTVLGAVGGALLGREIDRGGSRCR